MRHQRFDTLAAIAVLRERYKLSGHADIAQPRFAQHLHRLVDDLGALALQHIGKTRVVAQHRVIQLGKHGAGFTIPVLHRGGDQAAPLQALI